MKFLKSRKLRQGSIATAITVFGVVLIIIAGVLLSTLSQRNSWSLDLTENQLFAVSDETRDFLSRLEKDVQITILNTEDRFLANSLQGYMTQVNEIIKKYESLSSRINLQYIDIDRNPTFIANYPNQNLMPNQILLECVETGRVRVLQYTDLLNLAQNQSGQSYIRSSKAEQAVSSAILNITSDQTTQVAIIEGHNEADLTGFIELLGKNNYQTAQVNLLTGEDISPEVTIALMAVPQRDLTEDELRKLDRFLSNDGRHGKTLVYMTSADAPNAALYPNLNAWLAEWGVAVSDSAIFELDMSRRLSATNPYWAIVSYSSEAYAAELIQRQLYPLVIYSRSIKPVYEAKGSRKTETLLHFSSQSGTVPENATENWQPTASDLTGPHPALILTTDTKYDNLTPLNSHLLTLGAYLALDPQFLNSGSYANAEYFLGVLDKLAGRESSMYIKDKSISMQMIEITAAQANSISLAVFIIFPVALLIFGIVVWLRRRRS